MLPKKKPFGATIERDKHVKAPPGGDLTKKTYPGGDSTTGSFFFFFPRGELRESTLPRRKGDGGGELGDDYGMLWANQ